MNKVKHKVKRRSLKSSQVIQTMQTTWQRRRVTSLMCKKFLRPNLPRDGSRCRDVDSPTRLHRKEQTPLVETWTTMLSVWKR